MKKNSCIKEAEKEHREYMEHMKRVAFGGVINKNKLPTWMVIKMEGKKGDPLEKIIFGLFSLLFKIFLPKHESPDPIHHKSSIFI